MTATATRPDAGPAHETALPTIDHWIDGAANPGTSDRFGLVYNPALGTPSARVRFGAATDVDRAVDAATRAFAGWSRRGSASARRCCSSSASSSSGTPTS